VLSQFRRHFPAFVPETLTQKLSLMLSASSAVWRCQPELAPP
jgi:hypothetical protein